MWDRQAAEDSQIELLRRIATQDRDALANLYDQISGVIYSTAVRILGDAHEAEEVMQDAFLQIWNKADTFDPALGTPFDWSLRITRNRCIDRLRQRQRRFRVVDYSVETGDLSETAAQPTKQHDLTAEDLMAIRKSVTTLPEDQRAAIEMAFFGGMTHPEIAAALSEPLGTVKARIRRGMLKLRECLEPFV